MVNPTLFCKFFHVILYLSGPKMSEAGPKLKKSSEILWTKLKFS